MSVAASTEQTQPKAVEGPTENPGHASPGKPETKIEEDVWRPVLGLPCQFTVDLPLPNFKVADLLKLGVGSVIGTNWQVARDLPLRVNGTLIGWSEFEVVGNQLAVRLTELA